MICDPLQGSRFLKFISDFYFEKFNVSQKSQKEGGGDAYGDHFGRGCLKVFDSTGFLIFKR